MLPTPTRDKVRLAVRDGETDEYRDAYIYSGLALFRIQYGWNITHVNSGIRLMEVIGNKSLALSLLSTLLSNYPYWSSFGSYGILHPMPDEARSALRLAQRQLYPDLP